MSPVLFFKALDWLMRTVTQGRRQGIRLTLMTVLEDQNYADDIGLLSSILEDAQQKAERLGKTAKTIGLKVNTNKAQLQRKNTNVNDPIINDGKHQEYVERFTYFGTNVTTTSDCDQEINARISKANKAFAMLKLIWRTINLNVHAKIKIFSSNLLSVLLCGAECWKTTVAM